MDDATVLARSEGAVDAVVDGQTVLLSPTDFSYHGLDGTGAAVWGLLATPATVADVLAGLVELYAVTPRQCREDVLPFLGRLVSIGVLRADDPVRPALPVR